MNQSFHVNQNDPLTKKSGQIKFGSGLRLPHDRPGLLCASKSFFSFKSLFKCPSKILSSLINLPLSVDFGTQLLLGWARGIVNQVGQSKSGDILFMNCWSR